MTPRRLARCALVAGFALSACTTSGKSATSGTACPTSADPRAEFTCVVKNDHNDQYGWYNLGVIEQGSGNIGKAATDYVKAIAIQGDFESALYNLGVIRLQARDYNAAVALLNRAVAANPKDANAFFKLAESLGHLHTTTADERAKRALTRALTLAPPSLRFPPAPKPGK